MTELKENLKMPEQEKLVASVSPHIHSGVSIRKVMLLVIISLLPATFAGILFFGLPALKVIVLSVLFCVFIEWAWCRIDGRTDDWKDFSAVLTGLLLALNLSANVPWWICPIGAFLAIGIGKQLYGGIGYNPFNPALVARVGLLIGFPKIMTTWMPSLNMRDSSHPLHKLIYDVDATTCATPLGVVKTAVSKPDTVQNVFHSLCNFDAYLAYLKGDMPGCIGETSVIALLLGGVLLIALRLIKWQVPIAFIATVAAISGLVNYFSPNTTPGPIFHILTGGLILGAFFMATDMVTSPMTTKGAVIFGIGCGLITSLIRIWGGYPEGVSFSILIMNALTPLIDKFTLRKPFGFRYNENKV
ncbi:MAG TPA: RnfABCDGE type electron transport complex subunit D [Victivallales bacterium]|nr:RnfABCDGE type electron transport complex subunit D [Victivallales bacterium]HPO90899.1 RnfABCDGE type electron transport complex subunit D [Victivallales bacterium]HRR27923.1 RnfABCDGE type electron transport complex subunit D [Victivallales bacterium]HRU00374.1 RnfABCDGE type electron transport complex subunit D [Victivallales bacterium]